MKYIIKKMFFPYYNLLFLLFFNKNALSEPFLRCLKDQNSINYYKLPFGIYGFPNNEELKSISPEKLLYKLSKIKIKTNITIGSNKQKLPTDISFEHYTLYVSSDKCKEKNIIKFNQDKSTTFINQNKINGYNFNQVCIKCNISQDYFYIDNNNDKVQLSFVLGSLLKEEYEDVSAEIGLKPTKSKYDPSVNHILTQLKIKNLISGRMFMLHFYKKNNFDGELILGGYTDNYYKNNDKLKYFYISAENGNIEEWEFLLENAYYGKKYISQNNKVIISLKDMFIHTPYYMKKIIENEYFNEYVNKSICMLVNLNSTSSYFYVCDDVIDINKMNNFIFYPQNLNEPIEIIFTPKDLFYKFNDNKYIFLMEFNEHNNEWVFNLPFVMKYQPIFDMENKLISIYNNIDSINDIDFFRNEKTENTEINDINNNKNNNAHKLIAFVLLFFLLLILIIIIKNIRKSIRKKNVKDKKDTKYLEFRDMSHYSDES